MKRRDLLGLAAAGALCNVAPAAFAQPARRRVYMVTWRGPTDVERGFKDYLASHKVPVDYIMRDAGQDPKRLAEFAHEIRQLRPDLVFTWGTSATLGVAGPWDAGPEGGKKFIGDIPAVFALVSSPVGARIVPSLAAPGRRLTGVFHVAPLEAQLAAMRAYRPFTRVGVLYNAAEQNSVAGVREMQALAARDGFSVLEQTFRQDAAGKPQPDGIAERVQALARAGAQWLYIGPDTFLFTQLAAVAAAADAAKLPTFASTEAVIESPVGVLAGLVSKYYSIGQFTGYKAEQILVGRRAPESIPVETLKRFSFVVRMQTARRIGMLPPVALFNFAEFI